MIIELRSTVCAALLVLAACEWGPTEPEVGPPLPPNVESYVVGEARENLDAKGHFQLGPPTIETSYQVISPELAWDLAIGVVRTWYTNPNVQTLPGTMSLVEAAERQHGAPITWNDITALDRIPYFAESHLEPVPEAAGGPAIRAFGPHFVIPFYVGAKPVMSVAVSAYATNIYLDANGYIRWTDNLSGGGEFSATGTPLELVGTPIPPSPEEAVKFAFEQTGLRTAMVPVLGVPGNRVTPHLGRWKIRLEEAVEFERIVDGSRLRSADVYVGVSPSIADARLGADSPLPRARLRLFLAAEQQPDYERVREIEVPIRQDYAVDLHEVIVAR